MIENRAPSGAADHVAAAQRRLRIEPAVAPHRRDLLPREDERGRAVAAAERVRPGDRRSSPSQGRQNVEVRDRAQRGEVLDRLMRRAVLAEEDGVVRPDVDRLQLGGAAMRTGGRM